MLASSAGGDGSHVEQPWRWIRDGAGEAAWNMAVDEAILEAVLSGAQPPTVRVYTWRSPAISLGRFQQIEQTVDLQRCRERGISVVRRLTGGKAVLHGHDLTLCVVAPLACFAPARSVIEVHHRILRPLVSALSRVGVRVNTLQRTDRYALRTPHVNCFEHALPGDLVTPDGTKVLGGAQYRRGEVVMEQICLPVDSVPAILHGVLSSSNALPQTPLCGIAPARLEEAIQYAFAEEAGLLLKPSVLSEQERQRAQALIDGYLCYPPTEEGLLNNRDMI